MDPTIAAVQRRLQGSGDSIFGKNYEGRPPRTGDLQLLRGLEVVLRSVGAPTGEGGGGGKF